MVSFLDIRDQHPVDALAVNESPVGAQVLDFDAVRVVERDPEVLLGRDLASGES